jgi:hypothetical protein
MAMAACKLHGSDDRLDEHRCVHRMNTSTSCIWRYNKTKRCHKPATTAHVSVAVKPQIPSAFHVYRLHFDDSI